MSQPLLIHFISDFLRDPDLRQAVLKDDQKGPKEYGLSDAQITVLRTFDPHQISCEIRNEMLALGVDMKKKGLEVSGGTPVDTPEENCTGVSAMMAASAYSSGGVHPRQIYPSVVMHGGLSKVLILGNGFDRHPQVRFCMDSVTVRGTLVQLSSDVDLYQRLEIEVKLPTAGTWNVEVRNPGDVNWTACPFSLIAT